MADRASPLNLFIDIFSRTNRMKVAFMSETASDGALHGRNPVIAALESGRSINKIMIAQGATGSEIETIKSLARENGVVFQFVERRQLDNLAAGKHQGVVAMVSERAYVEISDILSEAENRGEPPFLAVLDGFQDPHNLGSVIRTADAAGVHGVVIPRRNAVGITSTVVKSSAGAVDFRPVARIANVKQALDSLKSYGIWCIGLEADGDSTFEKTDYTGPVAIVIGSEGKGLRSLVRKTCDSVVRLPIGGHTGSLNASVAAALVMYEVFRQRSGL